MPELPEVETVKEKLKKELLHKKIVDIKIFYDGIIATDLELFSVMFDKIFALNCV